MIYRDKRKKYNIFADEEEGIAETKTSEVNLKKESAIGVIKL